MLWPCLSALVSLAIVASAGQAKPITGTITVSAASSLTEVLGWAKSGFEQRHPQARVRLNLGASGALQRQIEAGAPADVFLSAHPSFVDRLIAQGLADASTRRSLAGNELILVVPGDSPIKSWQDLRRAPIRRVAIGEPQAVPAGIYAKEMLGKMKLWGPLLPKLVFSESVRAALTYCEKGDAEAAIVFASDWMPSKSKLRIAARAPRGSHAPILVEGIVLSRSNQPATAAAFLGVLASQAGQDTFRRYGFLPPPSR